MEQFKIPVPALSPSVDPATLGFSDTSQLRPLDETIWQDRAVEASTSASACKAPGGKVMMKRHYLQLLQESTED
jgi:hypothetical protein